MPWPTDLKITVAEASPCRGPLTPARLAWGCQSYGIFMLRGERSSWRLISRIPLLGAADECEMSLLPV
jgi:hypothetical protein